MDFQHATSGCAQVQQHSVVKYALGLLGDTQRCLERESGLSLTLLTKQVPPQVISVWVRLVVYRRRSGCKQSTTPVHDSNIAFNIRNEASEL